MSSFEQTPKVAPVTVLDTALIQGEDMHRARRRLLERGVILGTIALVGVIGTLLLTSFNYSCVQP